MTVDREEAEMVGWGALDDDADVVDGCSMKANVELIILWRVSALYT
jgi:hypothetical protein